MDRNVIHEFVGGWIAKNHAGGCDVPNVLANVAATDTAMTVCTNISPSAFLEALAKVHPVLYESIRKISCLVGVNGWYFGNLLVMFLL